MSDEKKRLAELDKQAESSAPGSSTLLDLPPSYEPQSAPRASQDDDLQAPEDFPILVIDDCRIYSAYAPTRTLYRLSNPVCDATRTLYGIEKFRYKVDNSSDDPKVRHTIDHIYDFERDIQLGALPTVHIKGFTSSKRTYKSAILSDATKIGRGYKVEEKKGEGKDNEEILKTERPFKDLLNQGRGNTVEWKDASGQVLAVETKLQRDKDKKIVEPPRLAIKANMDEKLYDFLVTSWCAVVWKEAKGDLKEPLTWEKFKDRASRVSNRGSVALWAGF